METSLHNPHLKRLIGMPLSNNRVEIDLAAVQANFKAIRQRVGSASQILAMVKADAYGHGLVPVALAIERAGGAYFGVAEVDEGIALREAGLSGGIVILLGSDYYDEIIHYNLSPVVFDLDNLAALSAAAVKKNSRVGVHLKVDVGMGRLGIMPDQADLFLRTIKALPKIYLAGIMGHFPSADNIEQMEATKTQFQKFSGLLPKEDGNGKNGKEMPDNIEAPLMHIANSAAIIHHPDMYLQLVRPGIALYGYHPAGRGQKWSFSVQPVMSFKTKVVQVKNVPAGYGISYGHVFVTKRATTLAVLPVGYADGYLRGLTGHAEVLIRGKRAPICGRICMNACLADVTDIPGVSPGEEVVLLGEQTCEDFSGSRQTISADEVAEWMGTISYEILCLFGSNNDRVYLHEEGFEA